MILRNNTYQNERLFFIEIQLSLSFLKKIIFYLRIVFMHNPDQKDVSWTKS